MMPFQQFQAWSRRAPGSQRLLAAGAAVVVIALVTFLVLPAGEDQVATQAGGFPASVDEGAAPSPTQTTATVTDGSAPPASDPSSVGADPATTQRTASSSSGGGAAGGDGPPGAEAATAQGGAAAKPECPQGTDKGVTETEVRVAITIINIAGDAGNSTIGVPTPEKQREQWQTVADAINAEGGAACRQIIPEFHSVNPIDANDAQQKCLEIAKSQPFMALDSGSLTVVGASDCIPNQQVPMLALELARDQMQAYYPYYIGARGVLDDILRNGYLGLAELGQFDPAKGFEKLGLLFRSCRQDPIEITRRVLAEAGVPEDKIVEFDLGCAPGQRNSPVEYQQAALTFKNAGATHVTHAGVTDFVNFVNAAAQQNYAPQYALADNGIIQTQNGALQPDPANLDGAANVVPGRAAEATTPGFEPSEGTRRCNEIFAAVDEPPVYEQEVGYGGVACSMLWQVVALIENAPALQRDALVQGIPQIGVLDGSYPEGPVDFGAVQEGTPYGKPFWRPAVYQASCRCWQTPDPDPGYQPSFP